MAKEGLAKKRILEGTVVSDKMEKTIIVVVARKVSHSMYKKTVSRNRKFKVHDSANKAKVGDRVKIVESRPYSKDKCFCLLEVIG